MPNPHSNRKKVRGWRRRLRQLERFRLDHKALDLEALAYGETAYVKLWLDPWHRLVKRNPPLWYRRRALAAFIDILGEWKRRLDTLGSPYYLRLWLFDPEFYETQVVAAIGSRLGFYDNAFSAAPADRAAPPAPYADPAYDLGAFAWTPCYHEDFLSHRWYAYDADEIARIERIAHHQLPTADGDTLYVVRRGMVWIGASREQESG